MAYCGLFLYTVYTCYSFLGNFLPVCTYYGMRLTVVCTETSSTYVSGFTDPSSPYKTFLTGVVNSDTPLTLRVRFQSPHVTVTGSGIEIEVTGIWTRNSL